MTQKTALEALAQIAEESRQPMNGSLFESAQPDEVAELTGHPEPRVGAFEEPFGVLVDDRRSERFRTPPDRMRRSQLGGRLPFSTGW